MGVQLKSQLDSYCTTSTNAKEQPQMDHQHAESLRIRQQQILRAEQQELADEANAAVLVARKALQRIFDHKDAHGNIAHLSLRGTDQYREHDIDFGEITQLRLIIERTIHQP